MHLKRMFLFGRAHHKQSCIKPYPAPLISLEQGLCVGHWPFMKTVAGNYHVSSIQQFQRLTAHQLACEESLDEKHQQGCTTQNSYGELDTCSWFFVGCFVCFDQQLQIWDSFYHIGLTNNHPHLRFQLSFLYFAILERLRQVCDILVSFKKRVCKAQELMGREAR